MSDEHIAPHIKLKRSTTNTSMTEIQETKQCEIPIKATKKNLAGMLYGLTVSSLVQILELEQKTCTLWVSCENRNGCIYMYKGVIVNAEAGELNGEQAACLILSWDDTQVKLEHRCEQKKRVIRSSLTRLILQASKQKDDSELVKGVDSELKHAIRMVEGQHTKSAHSKLIAYLKKNPKSSEAWLWYSRCLGNINAISTALKKCAMLAPSNATISREIMKVNTARQHIKDVSVRRCPFCWCPLERDGVNCTHCRASLVIEQALSQDTLDKVNSKFLIDAVTRYTAVVAHENNIKALYYLGLANCNLNKVEEALDLLNEAVRVNPENKYLNNQLNVLINYVATRLNRYEKSTAVSQKKNIGNAADSTDGKKKILVVDDSPTTRKVVVLTLKQKGYAIVEAQDGLEALSKIDEERPDLILLDIILPKMDGYKILSIIKENQELKDTPVIMLTSKDGIIDKVKGKLAGTAAYLTKPFQPKELIETVRKHMA